MKFFKITLLISLVLSAVLSRRSHSKSHDVAFKSENKCKVKSNCIRLCSNFEIKTDINVIRCNVSNCTDHKCVCGPAADVDISKIGEEKCQYRSEPPQQSKSPKKY